MKRLCLFLTILSIFVDFFDEMVDRFPKKNLSELCKIVMLSGAMKEIE